ncbi:acetyl/propionyl/methylcrotonyl-CoA carboxylase subunit alpha [Ramlibacter sp.]|uniref:acetyl/propionyl/methylcrotonyl-CoA carboxylase subunit alpha n=1 Tax=Ramlibacter sp. TaxID=1917967 RepID=UPI003D0CFFB8
MKKVLIANRGEIAVRIARACADHGVRSVAVYADADVGALHVRMADEAWSLEGEPAADTYLDIAKLIAIARRSGADAVHPGYGFLSENAAFARAVVDAGLAWIGPPANVIELLGDKVKARAAAAAVGAPLAPGTPDPVKGADEAVAFAQEHGLPIAIKAAFGGGGRGIRVARNIEELPELYDSAVREATAAFGRGECFVEKFLDRPRHVEAQVIADTHGHVLVLGTRDCSLQRRNQKLVEEAPAPFLSDAQRERIECAARRICASVGYVGAGTVEFLVSATGEVSFLEVNTRLQVEHPVTEQVFGIDLVVEQLRVAEGLPLSLTATPSPRGHAIEFRINAEDVGRGFLPSPGTVVEFAAPSGPGVRVDSGVESGSVVPGHFDSLVAKLVVHGATRGEALARARRALRELRIEGVPTVLPFHRAVVEHPDFAGEDGFQVHTRWIETEMQQDFEPAKRPAPPVAMALKRFLVEIDGRVVRMGLPMELLQVLNSTGASPAPHSREAQAQSVDVTVPAAGKLHSWKVDESALVAAGDPIAIVECMKMEMEINAHRAGRLTRRVASGSLLAAGAAIASID